MTSFQLRVQKLLVKSYGDIGKIRRVRREKNSQLQEEIRLEDRETFQKLSKKKVGKVGQ